MLNYTTSRFFNVFIDVPCLAGDCFPASATNIKFFNEHFKTA
jgi:hypothetical protein